MSDLTKRLREAGHNFNLPTVSEAITRANKFEGEAHLIAQLYPRDFDSIILRDRIDALEGVVRECRAAGHGRGRVESLHLQSTSRGQGQSPRSAGGEMSSAGRFRIEVTDPWPVWARLYVDGKDVGQFYAADLCDLAYAAKKAIHEARMKLKPGEREEIMK